MLGLADPWLLVLLPLPFALLRLLPGARAEGSAMIVPQGLGQRLLRRSAGAGGGGLHPLVLPSAVWLLLVLALAGPRQIVPTPALPISGRDLVLALDLSGSMVRDDFALNGRQTTRLDAVKAVGSDFVRGRAGDRVALVVFGSEAYFATPFTFDVDAVAQAIEEAVIGISGRATSISDGLGVALKRLARSDAKGRVVILLSDGVNNAGAATPRGVAGLAAELGVRVHTIALGPLDTETAAPGERGVVDAVTLRAIAEMSGGETFRVRTTEDLVAVTDAIDRLETTAADGLAAEIYREFWIWPATLALALCLLMAWRGRA